jgi:hypothetical protein
MFTGLLFASGIIYLNKVAEALRQVPGCYDERFETFCTPFDIVFGILIVLPLLILAYIPAKFRLRRWLKVPLCAMISLFIIADNYLSFTDYEVMKVMLKSPERKRMLGRLTRYGLLSWRWFIVCVRALVSLLFPNVV